MGGQRVGLLTVGVSFSSAGGTFWKRNHELSVQSFIPTSCGAASFFLTTSCLYVPPSDSDDFSGGRKAGSPHPPALERILFSQISLLPPTTHPSPVSLAVLFPCRTVDAVRGSERYPCTTEPENEVVP